MSDNNIEILEGLNGAQREAVVNYNGPSLIIAGAIGGVLWIAAKGKEAGND